MRAKHILIVVGTLFLTSAVLYGLYQLAVLTTTHCLCEVPK